MVKQRGFFAVFSSPKTFFFQIFQISGAYFKLSRLSESSPDHTTVCSRMDYDYLYGARPSLLPNFLAHVGHFVRSTYRWSAEQPNQNRFLPACQYSYLVSDTYMAQHEQKSSKAPHVLPKEPDYRKSDLTSRQAKRQKPCA